MCVCADDGSEDDVDGGSGRSLEQSGSGFDPDDFFTSGDVTTGQPAASDYDEAEPESRGLAVRTAVCSGWLVGLQVSCVVSLIVHRHCRHHLCC